MHRPAVHMFLITPVDKALAVCSAWVRGPE